jgi:hypothetical protein
MHPATRVRRFKMLNALAEVPINALQTLMRGTLRRIESLHISAHGLRSTMQIMFYLPVSVHLTFSTAIYSRKNSLSLQVLVNKSARTSIRCLWLRIIIVDIQQQEWRHRFETLHQMRIWYTLHAKTVCLQLVLTLNLP